MAELQLTEVAKTLADHFGARLEADRDEGRRLMAAALHQDLGISTREATRLIDALVHAGTIRWIDSRDNPLRPTLAGEASYWQLEPA